MWVQNYGGDEKASLKLQTPTIISMDKPDKPTKTKYHNWGAMEKEDYKMDNKEYTGQPKES